MRHWDRLIGGRIGIGALCVAALSGCGAKGSGEREIGSLALPLAANAASGKHYRLRDAIFDIRPGYYWGGTAGYSGFSGAPGNPPLLSVSSEDTDPDAQSIEVELEQGNYTVVLRPGWRFESVENGETTGVEATLLSDASQYLYVYPHSTSWASYQFGIGGAELWLNGKVNININVYEHPDEYYGPEVGGSGGFWNVGGAFVAGSPAVGGALPAAGGPSVGGAAGN